MVAKGGHRNPPTPGLGAAMLRVVEAAKALKDWHDKDFQGGELLRLAGRAGHEFSIAVKALNELEPKQ